MIVPNFGLDSSKNGWILTENIGLDNTVRRKKIIFSTSGALAPWKVINPDMGDVSDSTLNAEGGQYDTTSEMNEGVP